MALIAGIGAAIFAATGATIGPPIAVRHPSPLMWGQGGAATWDGTEPFRCGGNDQVNLAGVQASLPSAVAFTVTGNCQLTISDSTISALEGIDASGNGQVQLVRTRLLTQATGVRLSGNKTFELVESTIEASGLAVQAGGNAQVVLVSGRVQGCPQAVEATLNALTTVVSAEVVDCPAGAP
ncbi:MAG: hypothetical protein OEY14_06885 [Myxococcales bacterium]|nr:hypothetical protein [Myxococcales bacterium]